MLNGLIIILLLSTAYFLGFLLNRIARSEFIWFRNKTKQEFGRFRYIIATLAGISIGPTPSNTILLTIFAILMIYSALSTTNQNPRLALKHVSIQALIFIVAGLLSKGF